MCFSNDYMDTMQMIYIEYNVNFIYFLNLNQYQCFSCIYYFFLLTLNINKITSFKNYISR
jgi:hypothetical protein